MLHSHSAPRSRWAPRTLVAFTLAGAALCGVHPVRAGTNHGMVTYSPAHAPVRGQSPTPNRNATRMPATAGVLAGEPGLEPGAADYLRVIAPGGAVVSGPLAARGSGDATLFSVSVSGAARGWYMVHWNVTSGDGHPMGGDDGSWWTFGHRATTVGVARAATLRLSSVIAGGGTLTASMNGMRTGLRTVTVSHVPGSVYAARWTLQGEVDGAMNPRFSWDVTSNRAKKTATLSGIVPRAGTYVVSVFLTVPTATGTSLNEYTATVRITV